MPNSLPPYIKSKPADEPEPLGAIKAVRSVPIKFLKPTGWTQPIGRQVSAPKDMEAFRELITLAELSSFTVSDMNRQQ
jgi:hypothetical protein|tara:strand:- start:2597 stop:2830 length:234 start_codon:yes stop_codon:yes gene_type:complete